MTNYLMVFGANAMDEVPDEDMPAVDEAAHVVCQEAINAGVYVLAGGLEDHKRSVIVATDGTVTDGQYPDAFGGITVLDVPLREASAGMGHQGSRRLPLRSRGLGDRGRPQARGDAPRGR